MVTGNHSDKMGDETWEVGLYEGLRGRQFHAGRFLLRFTVTMLNLTGITELCALALKLVRRSVFVREIIK